MFDRYACGDDTSIAAINEVAVYGELSHEENVRWKRAPVISIVGKHRKTEHFFQYLCEELRLQLGRRLRHGQPRYQRNSTASNLEVNWHGDTSIQIEVSPPGAIAAAVVSTSIWL